MTVDLSNVVVGLLSGIVGSLGGYIATAKVDKNKNEREGQAIAQAIAAEITAILSLVNAQGYIYHFKNASEIAGRDEFAAFTWNAKRNYCRVFENNASNIGRLPSGAGDVVQFYNLLQSILEDQDQLTLDVQEAVKISMARPYKWRLFEDRYKRMSEKIELAVRLGHKALKSLGYEAASFDI